MNATSRSLARQSRRMSGAVPSLVLCVSLVAVALPRNTFSNARKPTITAANVAMTRAYASDARTPVAPGVVHDRGTIETDTAGRQAVHLLEVDTDDPAITLEASISNDRVVGLETTTAQGNRKSAEGHRIVGGINADFWGPREAPSGLHIQAEELVASWSDARPTFGIKADGTPIIGSPAITATATLGSGAARSINRINQTREGQQLVLYTPRFDSSTRTDATGTEVVLTGVTQPVNPPGTYTGTVSQVRTGAGDTPIRSGEVVLSGGGASATFLNALSAGETVTLTVSITAGWEDVTMAVGGGQYIVRNGAVNVSPHDPGFADVTHPRTAIGITTGGDVVMATVDGRQPGYSIGVRLDELGELMQSRGAVTAINLDGGGSTTMAIRRPGDDRLTTVNRGSDGFERAVSNSLLVFSSAPTGALAIINVLPSNVTILNGSRITYTVTGQDAAYNPVPVAPESITWSVSGSAATIDGSGRLTATASGTATVTATVGSVSGSTNVSVVSALSALEIRPNPAIVEPGATQTFTVTGRDASGGEVFVDPALVNWSVAGAIGTIDANGVFRAATTSGAGSVTATVGGATASARVDVGRPPAIIEDFEDISDMQAQSARGVATFTSAMRPNPVRYGTRSGRLGYDFTNSTPGTSAAYAAHSPTRPIDGRPLRIGVWLYGDGSRHWVRGNYRDGNNAQKTVNFTEAATPTPTTSAGCAARTGGIDWVGWKYLEAAIPADDVLPLKWERIYIVETVDRCDNAGEIYLDDLRAVYSNTDEDLVGPTVSNLTPEPNSTVFTSTPTVGGVVRDNTNGSGVAADSIRLLIDNVQVSATYDANTGQVSYTPSTRLADGRHRAQLEATDNAGNPALPFGDWSFTIYTGPDVEAPVIDRAVPLDGTTSSASRPRISARIRDPYRGVNPDTIEMTVDGNLVPAIWDAQAGVAWWAPSTVLTDGAHTVTLRVADRETTPNVATLTWTFNVTAIPQPAASAPFRLTWMADGGYFEGTRVTAATQILAEHLAREAAAPPDLLIFGGDLVENDQQINYDRAMAALDTVAAPRLVAAGNHEISGTLSRNRFWRTFGPTIAAVDYGLTDLLIVDSASSSLAYDTSQYAWLEAELAQSDARTVFVVLHVPTRDPFASNHGLPRAEGQRLEAIFAAAKRARPERDIVVLSGDVHAYGRWEQDGVTYIISGGAGGGLDATPAAGGFYHRLRISVDANGTARIDVIPLFEAINLVAVKTDLLGGETLNLTADGDVFTASAPDITIPVSDPVARTWRSTDPAVVSVNAQTGAIEAHVPGTATITVESGGASASVQISVTATLDSLRALTERARAEGGITHDGVYRTLLFKLTSAANGESGALDEYIKLLRNQRGRRVSIAWADRLIANASYLITRG